VSSKLLTKLPLPQLFQKSRLAKGLILRKKTVTFSKMKLIKVQTIGKK